MRLLRCVVGAAVCSVLLLAASPAGAQYPPGAGCTITPPSFPPGVTVRVSCVAATFAHGVPFTVTIASDPTVIATGTTAADGSLSASATIPASLPAGTHTITVTAGGVSDSFAVTVTSASVPAAGAASLVSSVPVTG